MSQATNLIHLETTLVIDAADQTDAFAQISEKLLGLSLVTDDFFRAITAREHSFPTGMDMSVVDATMPNFAIPHTDPEYVRTTRVVPVKLVSPVTWASITDADAQLDVAFLFMILNGDGSAQTHILAQIIDTVNTLGPDAARELFALTDPTELYRALAPYFEQEA